MSFLPQCVPFEDGNNESCTAEDLSPLRSVLHVGVHAFESFSGASLMCTVGPVTKIPDGTMELTNGVRSPRLSAAEGDAIEMAMIVPAGATQVSCVMTGEGDADMYATFDRFNTIGTEDPNVNDVSLRFVMGNAICPLHILLTLATLLGCPVCPVRE